jgi:hypothetical protein
MLETLGEPVKSALGLLESPQPLEHAAVSVGGREERQINGAKKRKNGKSKQTNSPPERISASARTRTELNDVMRGNFFTTFPQFK